MWHYIPALRVHIKRHLQKEGILLRKDARLGLWYSCLLPGTLVITTFSLTVSSLYCSTAVVSLGLLASSLLLFTELGKHSSLKCHSVIAFVIAVFLAKVCNKGYVMSFCESWGSYFIFGYITRKILHKFPKSFTLGEAFILGQGTTLFLHSCVLSFWDNDVDHTSHCAMVTVILQGGLLGTAFICWLLSIFRHLHQPVHFYSVVFFVIIGMVVPLLWIQMNQNPVLWLLFFLIGSGRRILLLIYWVACSLVAIAMVAYQMIHQVQASTVVRKYFHGIILAVYIPGLLLEPNLLYLASGVALAAFILLEIVRLLEIPPLGTTINDSFKVFLDEKDEGLLVLTNIYLLIGCSVPLWLYPANPKDTTNLLPLLSGILSIGIGDTAASVGGTLFGNHRWPGTKKTIEGTAFSIFLQMAALQMFIYLGAVPSGVAVLLKSWLAIISTALLEAFTTQVDNLVLPLAMYIITVAR